MSAEGLSFAISELIELPERQLVRFLIQEARTLYDFFNFVVEPALGPPPREGWDYMFFGEVRREDLGISPGIPGDIDALIVPMWDGKPVGERAAAIEVKRLALRGPNWSKNVDRYGVSQATGLLRCGFPYVGLLHIIVNNPGPPENWTETEAWRIIDEHDHIEFVSRQISDLTSIYACERQYARLLGRNPHSAIGLNCVGISDPGFNREAKDRPSIATPSIRKALPNPRVHPTLVKNIESFATAMRPLTRLRNADIRANSRTARVEQAR